MASKTAWVAAVTAALAASGASAARAADTSAADAPDKPGATYETLAQGATRTSDVATLLGAFIDRCDAEKRDLERARCFATQAYLREILPSRTFSAAGDDPAVISVSDYDASIKGYHLALAGCVACTKPVAVGRARERRFITLREPKKDAETLPTAVEISRNALGFESLPEAKRWLERVRPFLRAEFLFQPADAEWSFGPSRGYALKLVGGRVFNRCTGEVLVSKPPSTGVAELPVGAAEDPGCLKAGDGSNSAAASPDLALPEELSRDAIADAMTAIRPQVFACYRQHKEPGTAELTYVVAGNGMVQSIRVGGSFDGTPTGACVMEAAKNAHFRRFKAARQQFTYPFFLRP
ncbi:MAG TPA: hypothetical protein VHJ20_12745 [Polyangia bacterium]|nr:hypothetical protein [Polyangia bacterium]